MIIVTLYGKIHGICECNFLVDLLAKIKKIKSLPCDLSANDNIADTRYSLKKLNVFCPSDGL